MSDYPHLDELADELADVISDYYPSPDHVAGQTPPAEVATALLPAIHRSLVGQVVDQVNELLRSLDPTNDLARLRSIEAAARAFIEAEDQGPFSSAVGVRDLRAALTAGGAW